MIAGAHALRTACERDLARVWAYARQDGVFDSLEDLRRAWANAPWTVQVSDAGDAAILVRWRDHLRLVAVSALWSAERSIPSHMAALRAVARAQGFDDLISPFVPEGREAPYLRAGMHIVHTGVTMGFVHRHDVEQRSVPGVSLDVADESMLESLLAVDIMCFSEFWRYDVRLMREYLATDRTVIARRDDEVVGYAMCRVDRGHGLIGRLAVVPAERGRGVGAALLADALRYLRRQGVSRTMLYTQATNERAQRLYASFGFEATGPRKHLLAFSPVDTEEGFGPCT